MANDSVSRVNRSHRAKQRRRQRIALFFFAAFAFGFGFALFFGTKLLSIQRDSTLSRNVAMPRLGNSEVLHSNLNNLRASAQVQTSEKEILSVENETLAIRRTPRVVEFFPSLGHAALIRITSETAMKQHRFFRLKHLKTGKWLSRPVNTNVENSSTREKTFQFRFHGGKYDAWSIQGHTRMHLTCELSDRVTVDRVWARGFEMWFVVFGGPVSTHVDGLRALISKRLKSNKNTNTSGEYLYVVSRRNRKALVARDDNLWATGSDDNPDSIDAFELYADASEKCGWHSALSDDAMKAAKLELAVMSEFTVNKKKTAQFEGDNFKAIAWANMCWGAVKRSERKETSEHLEQMRDGKAAFPIFGSPKPPRQMTPENITDPYDAVLIARRTLANWAFLAGMQPLLLVDKAVTENLVASVKLELQQNAHEAVQKLLIARDFEIQAQYAQPTYRGLFKAALNKFPSAPAVMYSNMDILYTPSLPNTIAATLRFVEEERQQRMRKLSAPCRPKGWMIVGQRVNYNVPAEWTPFNNSDWVKDVEVRFAKRGELFESDAEDYFIVSRDLFDWGTIPDFVVGGVAFDNWIVSEGNKMASEGRAIVIDATRTITALHQNHGKNVKGSHKHPKSTYNAQLASMNGGVTLGRTTDTLFATEFNADGEVTVYDKHRLLFD